MSIDKGSIQVAIGRPGAETNGHSTANSLEEPGPHLQRAVTPLIDIHEGPEGLVLEADLPGAAENSVKIQLEDNVLILHAKVASSAPEGTRVLHEEYGVGDFFRSFILSDEVERSRITAELRNGVLRLLLPKAERAKTRRIEIRS
jgi:HSP20 family molecular chaperone IbpA